MAQQQMVDEKKAKEVADMLDKKVDKVETTEVTETPIKKEKRKKRGFIKSFLMFLGTLFLVAVLYLGWLGFIPGLSSILGANKVRDLGVTYTEADLTSYLTKTGKEIRDSVEAPDDATRPGKKVIFADPAPFVGGLTQSEITARINLSEWVYMPVSDVQVKFSDGNVVEASARLNSAVVDEFVSFIGGVGYSEPDVQSGLEWLNRFANNPAIYLKAEATVANNVPTLDVKEVKINRWSPPMEEANSVLYTALINALAGTAGLDIDSVTFSEGVLNFSGVGPTITYEKRN